MASERAKELAAKQKAVVAAEKERRRNSQDPRDWSQTRQIRELFKMVSQQNPRMPWLLGAAFLVPVAIGVVLGILFLKLIVLFILLGVAIGLALALWLFNRQVKTTTYARAEGQAGSAEVALQMLDKKQWRYQPAVNFTRQMDVIHRAIGPGGLVLVGEGDPRRVKVLLDNEAKRTASAGHKLKVTKLVMGDGQGQVPLNQLTDTIKKLPKVMEADQVDSVDRRLKALDATRPRVAMPKGPMPTRGGSRQAMRGR